MTCLTYLWNGPTQTSSCSLGVDSTWFNATQGIWGNVATNVSVSRELASQINSVAVAEGADSHFVIDEQGFIGIGFLDVWQINGRKKLRNLKVSLTNHGGSP